MGIMTVLTGCSSGSKEIYTPQKYTGKRKQKKVSDKICEKRSKKRGLQKILSHIFIIPRQHIY